MTPQTAEVRCISKCEGTESESQSQPLSLTRYLLPAVLASVKVRNLKANHNRVRSTLMSVSAVLARVKVRNLKANHSSIGGRPSRAGAVLASMKVRNLKANHNAVAG